MRPAASRCPAGVQCSRNMGSISPTGGTTEGSATARPARPPTRLKPYNPACSGRPKEKKPRPRHHRRSRRSLAKTLEAANPQLPDRPRNPRDVRPPHTTPGQRLHARRAHREVESHIRAGHLPRPHTRAPPLPPPPRCQHGNGAPANRETRKEPRPAQDHRQAR